MKIFSVCCPLCGVGFKEGDAIMNAFAPVSWGGVGVTFHIRCFNENMTTAEGIVRAAVEKAMGMAPAIIGGSLGSVN